MSRDSNSNSVPPTDESDSSSQNMLDVEKRAADHQTVTNPAEEDGGGGSEEKKEAHRQTQDAFGDESQCEDGDVRYKTLEWWQAGMIMIAETISLGILSLPSVLATIGMAGGAVLILGLGALATYSGYVIGQFREAHPFVQNMADAGYVLFLPWGPHWAIFGQFLLGGGQILFLIFAMASHILTWTICLSTLTNGAICTVIWAVAALFLFWLLDLPRTLKKMSYLSVASCLSIVSAVIITMVDVGITNPGHGMWSARPRTASFTTAFLSVSNIVFAYAGHVAFFGFIAEFKRPQDFPKALFLLQGTDTAMYFIVALVLYRYGGDDIASPAFGSADHLIRKVAWGIAIPTIIIAGVIYGHVASKMIFVFMFRGTEHMKKRTWRTSGSWWAITFIIWVIAFLIAETIPDFNDLLAFISALFASWFTYGVSAIFWFFLNAGNCFVSRRSTSLFALNVLMFTVGAGICVMGLYSSGEAIAKKGSGGIWTCKSNTQ